MTQMVAYNSRESITAVQSVMMQNPGFNITKLFCARLEWKKVPMTNTLAYNSSKSIKVVQSVIMQALVFNATKLFCA
jgi:hypothetical protein